MPSFFVVFQYQNKRNTNAGEVCCDYMWLIDNIIHQQLIMFKCGNDNLTCSEILLPFLDTTQRSYMQKVKVIKSPYFMVDIPRVTD